MQELNEKTHAEFISTPGAQNYYVAVDVQLCNPPNNFNSFFQALLGYS